jgi:hypothetical protein
VSTQIAQLVVLFVAKVNASSREPESLEEVPDALRDGTQEDDWTSWLIRGSDNAARIEALEKRLGAPFPPSFREFLSRYSFPAFEFGSLMFFANTGKEVFWELGTKLFADPYLSPFLLKAGYIQIGNPWFYNYDPVCFESKAKAAEGRIVQIDHEAILCFEKLPIVRGIAPSFVEFMRNVIERADA